MTRARGFTFIEALISGFLLMTMLGLVAGIVRQYVQVDRAAELGEKSRIQLRVTLDDMLSEAEDAFEITPADGTTSSSLILSRLDPTQDETRIPFPVPTTPPATWLPTQTPGYRMTVRYYKDADQLRRQASSATGVSETSVFQGLAGLSCRRQDGVLEISLSTERDGRVEVRRSRTVCRCL